jgi:hypothetical protein
MRNAPSHTLGEAEFVDRVSASLETGAFVLIIVGDGIRSDIHALVEQPNAGSGLAAELALAEFQLGADMHGELLLQPCIPLRSEVIRQCTFVILEGVPVAFKTDETAMTDSPSRPANGPLSLEFPWQGLLAGVLRKASGGRAASPLTQMRIEKHRPQLEACEAFCDELGGNSGQYGPGLAPP